MKCKDFEIMMLLKQTGELPDSDAKQLSVHLQSCKACASSMSSLARLCTDSRQCLLNKTPSPEIVAAVLNNGKAIKETNILILVKSPLIQFLALAASTVIVAVTCLLLMQNNTSRQAVNSHSSAALDLASIATFETYPAADNAGIQRTETSRLADKLLEIEGFTSGDSEEDLFTLFLEPSTIDPRSRSTLGSPSKTHV